ncbi:AzlD domain-containing protein [Streptococcus sobrinus]|uniref:AzlD domain-containing protein n=1 Tax=Streptococcus sobrinus TaxID=1310 RepID=UPI0002F02983|nr:AzlD domain-containing protein [Streptococcus sobrinus]OZV24261.1 branched-chain amino acid permease [Streptococcus sobrinus]
MTNTSFVLLAILLGFVVTWIPRVAPFVLVKYRGLSDIVVHFLKYLPVTILFALTLSSLFSSKVGHLPKLNGWEALASLPTLFVAIRTKNLLYAVLTGIVSLALMRLIF